MIQNALLEMELLDSAKETPNKLRWDADVEGTCFSLYIPKWRVPEPWPSRIWVTVIPRRTDSIDPPNLTPTDTQKDGTLKYEPIVTTVEMVSGHSKTVHYRPTSAPDTWEIGEPYVPFAMTGGGAQRLRMVVMWDVTSRGLFVRGGSSE